MSQILISPQHNFQVWLSKNPSFPHSIFISMLSSIEKISLSISFGYQNKIFYAWHGRSRSRSIDNILCASNIPNWIYFSAFSLSLNLLKFTGWILIDVSEIHFMENNRLENLLEFFFPHPILKVFLWNFIFHLWLASLMVFELKWNFMQ